MSEHENKNNDIKFEDLTDNYSYQQNNDDQKNNDNQQNNGYTQPIWSVPNNSEPEKPSSTGFNIASLVLGILSLIMCCCASDFLFFVPIILGILAIVFYALAKKKGGANGMAIAGLVCGIIGVAMSLLSLGLRLALGEFFDELFSSILESTLDI